MRTEVVPVDLWPTAVADRFLAVATNAPRFRCVLPTGSTPKPFYDVVVGRQPDLSHVALFLLDEFGDLPPGHQARCEVMLRHDLIDRLDRPPHLHAIDVESPQLDSSIGSHDSLVAARGLDLVVLGLGMNGHVGLNEPGSTSQSPTRRVALDASTQASAAAYADGTHAPTWGVTLGMDRLLAAGEVWLLVTGPRKRGILEQVRYGSATPDVPASLLQTHPNALVVADDEAMS